VYVILGKTAKKGQELNIPVYSVIIHPEYDHELGLNDIAIIGLSERVEFTG
jgi:hypothetical protein